MRFGVDEKRYYECMNMGCRHSFKNQGRDFTNISSTNYAGKHRGHFKLSKEDYVQVQRDAVDMTLGAVGRKWGITRRHVKRICNLNLSSYAEKLYGELPAKSLNRS